MFDIGVEAYFPTIEDYNLNVEVVDVVEAVEVITADWSGYNFVYYCWVGRLKKRTLLDSFYVEFLGETCDDKVDDYPCLIFELDCDVGDGA